MKSRDLSQKQLLSVAITALMPFSLQAESRALEEVVVTAQKRAENLQDIPISVTAIASGELEGLKLRDTSEITAQVPNLQASPVIGDGMPIFSLRGVSMNDFTLNQNSPVAIYVNEVYKGNPALQGVQIFDLERIEVLRGPQGTLYGKNSTGGAVNFISRKPAFENEGYVTVGAGSYSLYEADAAINFPVGDKVAVRVAGTWTEADGWLKNKNPGVDDANAVDEYGARLSVLWEASDDLEALLFLARGKSKGVNYGIIAENIGPGGVGNGVYGLYNTLGFTDAVDSTRAGLGDWEFDGEREARRLVESDSASLTINWNISDQLALTSITSYDDGEAFNPEDADGTANALINVDYAADVEQFSQDLRVTSDYDGPFNFIAGVYFAREDIYNQSILKYALDLDLNGDRALDFEDCSDPLNMASGLPVTPEAAAVEESLNEFGLSLADLAGYGCQTQNDFDQERTSQAVYFDSSYEVNEAVTLRVGLRYTEDETELDNFSARYLGNDDTPLFATIPYDESDPYAQLGKRKFKDDKVTGKLGIDYTTSDGTLFYASYSQGYRTGAFNSQAYNDISEITYVDPETLDSFEVGFKSSLVDGSVQLNGAAFLYKYENQQFLDVDDNLIQRLINIGESEIKGLELELVARPTDTLMLRSGLGLLDSEVKEGVLGGMDLSGNSLPQAPEINFNISADWDVFVNDAGVLTLHIDSSYVDDQFFEVANTDHAEADSYWLVNGRLTFEASSDRWAVSVWGKNLFEEYYQTSILDFQTFFGYNYTHPGAPRTYGADLTFRF